MERSRSCEVYHPPAIPPMYSRIKIVNLGKIDRLLIYQLQKKFRKHVTLLKYTITGVRPRFYICISYCKHSLDCSGI